jgi:hypothetical protein
MSYEVQDASLRVIGISAALLLGGIALSIGASAWWYHVHGHGADFAPATARQTSFQDGAGAESSIERDWRTIHVAADKRLTGYGWVDRRAGVVHIPIERAMALVAGGAKPVPGPKETGQVP